MAVSYDKLSPCYDLTRWADQPTVDLLRRVLDATRGSRMLDIGCGTGNFTQALRASDIDAVGLDRSSGMLCEAKRKGVGGHLVLADATKMPFSDNAFDGAFAIQVVHHIEGRPAFFREAARVLRPGSKLAVQSCSHAQLETFWLYHYWPTALGIDKRRIPDLDELFQLFRQAGFSDVQSCPCPTDEFLDEHPEDYLSESYRAGQSVFALMQPGDIETGCEALKRDMASDAIGETTSHYQQKALALGGRVSLVYGKAPTLDDRLALPF